jgi:hypothetical protein
MLSIVYGTEKDAVQSGRSKSQDSLGAPMVRQDRDSGEGEVCGGIVRFARRMPMCPSRNGQYIVLEKRDRKYNVQGRSRSRSKMWCYLRRFGVALGKGVYVCM